MIYSLMCMRTTIIFSTAWKVSKYGVTCCPYFPVFGLNKEIYSRNFIKKETLTQVFSCEFFKIAKSKFSYRTPSVAASASIEVLIKIKCNFYICKLVFYFIVWFKFSSAWFYLQWKCTKEREKKLTGKNLNVHRQLFKNVICIFWILYCLI